MYIFNRVILPTLHLVNKQGVLMERGHIHDKKHWEKNDKEDSHSLVLWMIILASNDCSRSHIIPL